MCVEWSVFVVIMMGDINISVCGSSSGVFRGVMGLEIVFFCISKLCFIMVYRNHFDSQ